MEDKEDSRDISARLFINHCKAKFGWSDLSNHLIMDLGCGENASCAKAILEKFPDVQSIICIDKDPNVARKFRLKDVKRVGCEIADILNRQSLEHYEGQMSKVLSTHLLHQIDEKEEAFRKVYHLLKPGGEAAFLFVMKSSVHDWLAEFLKIPKWKGFYQRRIVEDMYKSKCEAVQYKEMVEKIGFQVVECTEVKGETAHPSDEVCKERLNNMCGKSFKVPPEHLEEFKEECFKLYLKLNGRNDEELVRYKSIELSLLLVKPMEVSDSESKPIQES